MLCIVVHQEADRSGWWRRCSTVNGSCSGIVGLQEGKQTGEGGGGVALLMAHALYCSSSRRPTDRSGWWRRCSTVNDSCSVL